MLKPDMLNTLLERLAAPAQSTLPLPHLLVILAHPDDEVVALGARLERLRNSRLLHITDGAPLNGGDARNHGFPTLDAYRKARQAELHAALAHANLPPDISAPLLVHQHVPLLVDQHVPADQRVLSDQTAALHLPQLTRAVAQAIQHHRPEAILTHPYEGGHPDHDSCAFAVHTAIRLLPPELRPTLIEAPFYHAGPHGIETGRFLRHDNTSALIVCDLSPAEQTRKRERLACFSSQGQTLAQFSVEQEQFRLAPACDFTQPPHPGPLFYDHFPWGMTGTRFLKLASAALADLGLARTTPGCPILSAPDRAKVGNSTSFPSPNPAHRDTRP